MLKTIVIKLIIYYQNKAPPNIRESCLYTPTCSQYMILAIEEYGVLYGVTKGIKRIVRCRAPYGGTDSP